MIDPFTVYEAARFFITIQEGFMPVAKKPMEGDVLTIGYGHTGVDVAAGSKITFKEAELMLAEDIIRVNAEVVRFVILPLYYTGEQVALISLVFNIGNFAFNTSRAGKALNEGNFDRFRFEVEDPVEGFVKMRKGGRPIPGLIARRKREMALFFGED